VGVLLNKLTPETLLEALRQRRFFATENENIQFVYYGHGQGKWVMMGQEIVDDGSRLPIVFTVRYADPDGRTVPHRFEVWSGQKELGSLTITPKAVATQRPTGGSFTWQMPPTVWNTIAPRTRVAIWVRFYEKENGQDIATFSAPIFLYKPF